MFAEFAFVPLVLFIVIGLPIICGTLISLARILSGREGGRISGRKKRHGGGAEADEGELIQEIHRGLNRMEARIEALETIVLHTENKPSPSRSTHE